MNNWVTPEKEIQPVSQETNTQEPNEGTPTNWEARHKEASDTLSKLAEQNIKTNVKLAQSSPEEILNMEPKLQNKVIGEIYGYNNLEELKLIQWDEFWKGKEEQEMTDVETLSQKIKILDYQNKKSELTRAMEDYQKDNKEIFSDNEDALSKIESELAYISDTLPAKERVERAGKILFWDNYVDNTTSTYLSMQDSSISAGANKAKIDKPQGNSFADFARAGWFLKK